MLSVSKHDRAILGIVIGVFLLGLFVLQLGSDSLTASAGAPGTFPTRIAPGFGRLVYTWLDHLAPAPYVETTLAQDALARGDAGAAKAALRPFAEVALEFAGAQLDLHARADAGFWFLQQIE